MLVCLIIFLLCIRNSITKKYTGSHINLLLKSIDFGFIIQYSFVHLFEKVSKAMTTL